MQISEIFKMIIVLMVLIGSALLFVSCTPSTLTKAKKDSGAIHNQEQPHVYKGHGGYGGGQGGGGGGHGGVGGAGGR